MMVLIRYPTRSQHRILNATRDPTLLLERDLAAGIHTRAIRPMQRHRAPCHLEGVCNPWLAPRPLTCPQERTRLSPDSVRRSGLALPVSASRRVLKTRAGGAVCLPQEPGPKHALTRNRVDHERSLQTTTTIASNALGKEHS